MYTIGQFSKKTGVTIRALRYYDEKNLLKPAYISPAGRRYYEDQDLVTLQRILIFKYLGYALEDIQGMLMSSTHNLHDSLLQQKQEMLIKKAQLEKTIETLDHAIALSEKQEQVHTDIFLALIHDLIRGDEQKSYLKTFLPEDLVEDLYDFSNEELILLNKHFMAVGLKIKEAYRLQLTEEEVLPLLEELFAVIPQHIMDRIVEVSLQIDEQKLQLDSALFNMPFTKEEEKWLEPMIEKLSLWGEMSNESST
ncbi:MerR family transcriptional regulator [Paenibacillus septentrionalis]|uniref:MerR family transcriptional regulator n=1 Tax=Paenibacillus septentrionalis TaxID=429342 RepID=A0ABW1V7G1_9BACL